jgi:hypothetical protein
VIEVLRWNRENSGVIEVLLRWNRKNNGGLVENHVLFCFGFLGFVYECFCLYLGEKRKTILRNNKLKDIILLRWE